MPDTTATASLNTVPLTTEDLCLLHSPDFFLPLPIQCRFQSFSSTGSLPPIWPLLLPTLFRPPLFFKQLTVKDATVDNSFVILDYVKSTLTAQGKITHADAPGLPYYCH